MTTEKLRGVMVSGSLLDCENERIRALRLSLGSSVPEITTIGHGTHMIIVDGGIMDDVAIDQFANSLSGDCVAYDIFLSIQDDATHNYIYQPREKQNPMNQVRIVDSFPNQVVHISVDIGCGKLVYHAAVAGDSYSAECLETGDKATGTSREESLRKLAAKIVVHLNRPTLGITG